MNAKELEVVSFLKTPDTQFIIPIYQRNYDWGRKECSDLFKDIIDVVEQDRSSHFIGSIVFIYEGLGSSREVRELVIIDGQQRLTSLSILLVALYRFALESGQGRLADRIYKSYLCNEYVEEERYKLKLKQTDKNALAFEAILWGEEDKLEGYTKVLENYRYFRSLVHAENLQLIEQGIKRLIFVEIALERGKDDPQRIFESLNSTGLDLSQSDLIRNYILMDLEPKEQGRVYKRVWYPIEENARDWGTEKSMVSAFIRDYLTLKNKAIPNKSKVYQTFKEKYQDKKGEEYWNDLEQIKSLSYHYHSFINPRAERDKDIRQELEYINQLEVHVVYPFLLQLFEDKDNGVISKSDLIAILQFLQAYVWRRFIVGLPTSVLNKIFMVLYAEVDSEDYVNSIYLSILRKKGAGRFPLDAELQQALRDRDLYNITARKRDYLFEKLENYNNREFVDTSDERISVEHIFPQKPSEAWREELSEEEIDAFERRYLHTIGNLTLSGNNGALGNKTFRAKKEMNIQGKEQGYQYSRLWLNKYLSSLAAWDLRAYHERTALITARFLKIWPYPEVELNEELLEPEMNIFEASMPKNKKLAYFIFEGEKLVEHKFTQMYLYVLRQLYQKDAALLLSQPARLKVSERAEDFRAPQLLVGSYFVETNLDSNKKFVILKRLLPSFGLEDALAIKYGEEEALEEKTAARKKDRFFMRKKYWTQLLPQIKDTTLFQRVSPSKDHWLSCGAGTTSVYYSLIMTKDHARIELSIIGAEKAKNKKLFKKLFGQKEEIEEVFGEALVWQELPDNKMSRIRFDLEGVSLGREEDWPKANRFFVEYIPRMEKAFYPYLKGRGGKG
ncbi:DUF4268 domain-containing protein [Saprospira sp. CCB-QB6]|uniref:DUF4268 domain-containing protein n=1 Tax=Saprospira sp. CCB-QB6 TaxID=3023936 RepID=UPI002349D88F|nr:DUF4268 domain-containing protein [Saprospira sp. CCB-QB6]WCL81605.1 DUF4268 domain-containing protein [Saprospira sp. CCB-QB6]